MDFTNFSTRLPPQLLDALDAEAAEQLRSRNQMLLAILSERYKITFKDRVKRARAAPSKPKQKAKAAVN